MNQPSECCGAEAKKVTDEVFSHSVFYVCSSCNEVCDTIIPNDINHTPKQDSQRIDEAIRDLTKVHCSKGEARRIVEAYCAERESLARIDLYQSLVELEGKTWELDELIVEWKQRLASLQKQSRSQEEHD
jgi:hypothetical protein